VDEIIGTFHKQQGKDICDHDEALFFKLRPTGLLHLIYNNHPHGMNKQLGIKVDNDPPISSSMMTRVQLNKKGFAFCPNNRKQQRRIISLKGLRVEK